jgi:hypothetical protein
MHGTIVLFILPIVKIFNLFNRSTSVHAGRSPNILVICILIIIFFLVDEKERLIFTKISLIVIYNKIIMVHT